MWKDRLYLNESLTAPKREIFSKLLELKKQDRIWTVFTRDGIPCFKPSKDSPPSRVFSMRQLTTILQRIPPASRGGPSRPGSGAPLEGPPGRVGTYRRPPPPPAPGAAGPGSPAADRHRRGPPPPAGVTRADRGREGGVAEEGELFHRSVTVADPATQHGEPARRQRVPPVHAPPPATAAGGRPSDDAAAIRPPGEDVPVDQATTVDPGRQETASNV